ncbi:uncharacterized protein LOC121136753 [Mesocricetus auratus]|uniref:Uncharacterized protein LOC121136753 n=1 Tax=Mesocricetus auratus TaxID=10036 RepID=A0ABM2WX06_MESAU|nr:uncharacterized protein LOC121136753 [Mesocricetus auratus]
MAVVMNHTNSWFSSHLGRNGGKAGPSSRDQGADVSEDGPEGKKSSSGGEPHIKSAPHFKPATTGDFRKDLGPPSQGGAAPDLRWRTRKWKLRVFPQRAGNRLGAARGPPKAHPGSRTRMTRSHSLGDFFRPPQTLLDASSGADGSTPISRDPWIYQRPPPHSPGPDSWGGSDGAQSGGSAAEERSVHAPARPSLACTPPGWSPALAPGPGPFGLRLQRNLPGAHPPPWNLSAARGVRVRVGVYVVFSIDSSSLATPSSPAL